MQRASTVVLLVLLAAAHSATAEPSCDLRTDLREAFGSEDGFATFLVLNATMLEETSALPNTTMLLVPSRRAWLDFFKVMGFNTIHGALNTAAVTPDMQERLNSVMLYHVVGTPILDETPNPIDATVSTALAGFTSTLFFPNGSDDLPSTVEGLVTSANVLDVQWVCDVPTLLLDAVVLPDQLSAIPLTPTARIPAAIEALNLEEEGPVTPLPPRASSPPPPKATRSPPSSRSCPYSTWADTATDFPDLTIMAGLLRLANLTLDVIGGPADNVTIMLPTSSAMLNAIHSLEVTDELAVLLITRVPAIASYLVATKALPLSKQVPATSVNTLLGKKTGTPYLLTLRVSTNALTVPNQVRGNFNTGKILGSYKICGSYIFQMDKTLLPSDQLEDIPIITFSTSS